MSPPLEHFDDPALKHALKRIYCQHRASVELRRSIAEVLASQKPRRPTGWRIPFGHAAGYSIAATLAVFIGAGIVLIAGRNSEHAPQNYLALNQKLLDVMLADHQGIATFGTSGEGFEVVAATDVELADLLSKRLGRPVPALALLRGGWTVRSARMAKLPLGYATVVRLKKGDASVSFYSLPSKTFEDAEPGTRYEYRIENFIISGIVQDGGVHCVVADPSVPIEQVRAFQSTLDS